MVANTPLIQHRDDLTPYSPAGHSGTTNVRLVEAAQGGHFEMIHGTMEAGGEAVRHRHEHSYQAIYIISGEALIELDENPARRCPSGAIVRIPPGVEHFVRSTGNEPLRMIIVYSPPL